MTDTRLATVITQCETLVDMLTGERDPARFEAIASTLAAGFKAIEQGFRSSSANPEEPSPEGTVSSRSAQLSGEPKTHLCEWCNFKGTPAALQRHALVVHPELAERVETATYQRLPSGAWSCGHCEFGAGTEDGILAHVWRAHIVNHEQLIKRMQQNDRASGPRLASPRLAAPAERGDGMGGARVEAAAG